MGVVEMEELVNEYNEIEVFDSHKKSQLEKYFSYKNSKWHLSDKL
jgi:hypothetical protein